MLLPRGFYGVQNGVLIRRFREYLRLFLWIILRKR